MFLKEIIGEGKKAIKMTGFLVKIILPVSLGIKILQDIGFVEVIANFLSPLMNLVGLSGELGIVWITAMLTNIYGGLITLFNMTSYHTFTTGEITILATMILLAHSMIVETRVLTKAGAKGKNIVLIRVLSALFIGFILNIVFSTLSLYEKEAILTFRPSVSNPNYLQWFIGQIKNYFNIFVIIYVLLVLMKFLEKSGVLEGIKNLLKPLLNLLGISKEASTINLVALTLGISYGGALLLDEVEKGKLSSGDIDYSTTFMALCHAIVEDTLLMLSIGASLWGILVVRFFYAFFYVFLLNKIRTSYTRKKQEVY